MFIPTDALFIARRSLETVPEYELLEDLHWCEDELIWQLHFRLKLCFKPDQYVPAVTNWYALISATYPYGSIKLYPASEGGITHTFPHQDRNKPGKEKPWRTGDLCLNTSLRSFARRGYDVEPYDAEFRLAWHVNRAVAWLQAAANGTLLAPGDPFELPAFQTGGAEQLIVSEDADSFTAWNQVTEKVGLLKLKQLVHKGGVWVVSSFLSENKRVIHEVTWGEHLNQIDQQEQYGLWVKLNTVPVLPPWQAPQTWGELYQAAVLQGIDLQDMFTALYRKTWPCKPTFLVIGFAVPLIISELEAQIQWQALRLPARPKMKGFRLDSDGYRAAVVQKIFHKDQTVQWVETQNWSQMSISARGHVDKSLASKKTLIIGSGAVGSSLGELLVRAGCIHVTMIDYDLLEGGNLARHTLTLNDVNEFKAIAVAKRLNATSPHAIINAEVLPIRAKLEQQPNWLRSFDVIIDATANDDVLDQLDDAKKETSTVFFSVSLGFEARRLFLYAHGQPQMVSKTFREKMQPWLQRDLAEQQGESFPRESIGCWHPLFPARADDVWMMTASAVKLIEAYLLESSQLPTLTVIEQQEKEGRFTGINVIPETSLVEEWIN